MQTLNNTAGQILKKRRQKLKLSLTDVELATKIRGKFLTVLESGDYDSLPNDIYSRGFVNHYASYLGLDARELTKQYLQERGGLGHALTKAPQMEKQRRMVVTVRLAIIAGGVLAVGALILYLSYQLSSLAAPPRLALNTPTNNQVVTSPTIIAKGSTTPGSDVLVDDISVPTDSNGNFKTTIVLQNGVNTITVSSTSKLNKVTNLTRNVLARLPQAATPTATVPAAVFNGVAIAVQVKGSATAITVTVDGQEKFNGIFLPGEQLLFTGTSDIKLTTSNAGDTSVVITNQNVVAKSLSPLGAQGEVRMNQDFAAGRNFP